MLQCYSETQFPFSPCIIIFQKKKCKQKNKNYKRIKIKTKGMI